MTDLQTAAQQALEALEMCRLNGSQYLYGNERDLIFSAIKALRAALAQQAEPVEPVAKCIDDICSEHFGRVEAFDYLPRDTLLYTAPPQRKPLPKHDQHCVDVPGYGLMPVRLVRAVERAHGIKE